ncbi:hypothetical protein Tdes44962_MAKER03462 [Teratosphaeria destructans]|uniref:Uncharacterized protein n=1 Tax=Teratosphaeria destructans TaxID=418781 RepID=A0A9W7SQ00_9PEZI|nr:hypothetical protein Tdes44962_MAKER03462 [Teratosphaeria destructans]
MAPKSSSSNNKSGGGNSNYAIAKDYGGQKGFMESYGLKMHSPEDVQEAKAIQDAMREADQRQEMEDKASGVRK